MNKLTDFENVMHDLFMYICNFAFQGTKLHHLRAEISPCHFYVYDTDRDGVIIYDEMRALFKDEQVTVAEHLFHELDSTTGIFVLKIFTAAHLRDFVAC